MALLANQIWQCLDLDLLEGSQFLAEQLVANEDTADTRYVLAYVQYRQGQYESAKLTSKNHLQQPGCVWVYAQSCLKLRQGPLGIKALDDARKFWDLGNDMPLPVNLGRGELSPAAFHLLYAKLQILDDPDAAINELTNSVRLNPYLFENVKALCASAKVKVRTKTLFSRFEDPFNPNNAIDALNSLHPPRQHLHETNVDETASLPQQTTTSTPRRLETPRRILSTPMAPKGPVQTGHTTNMFAPSPGFLGGPSLSGILNTNRTKATAQNGGNYGLFQTPVQTNNPHFNLNQGGGRRQQERMLSLSFRKQDQTSLSSLGKGVFASPHPQSSPESTKQGVEALETIMEALELLSESEFNDALQLLKTLVEPIRKTPFVLELCGRLSLELAKYTESVEFYEELRNLQPDRVAGMEYMSTALWHLKRDSNLSLLGYELTRKGTLLRQRWQSWCALGNAFSLRHDTHNAIKCFQRATVINPFSEYAHTMMGYEYMANDELENATQAFAKALQVNPQHYNAWYGLGSVHFSLGQYDVAEMHFTQAIRLNPNNPILLCLLGAVLEARGKFTQALAQFDRACQLNPASPMPRFRKAETLLEAGLYKDALKELLEIEKIAPEDPAIHFAIGKAHKGLGDGELAVQRFTGAQQLAPKMTTMIRRELDAM